MYCIVLAADVPGDVGLHDDISHSGEVPVSRPSSLHNQEQVWISISIVDTSHICLRRSKLTAVHLAVPSMMVSVVLSGPSYFLAHTVAPDTVEAVVPDTDAENQHSHPDPEDAAAKHIIAVILENVELDPCLDDLKTPLLKFADWRGGQTSVSGCAENRQ